MTKITLTENAPADPIPPEFFFANTPVELVVRNNETFSGTVSSTWEGILYFIYHELAGRDIIEGRWQSTNDQNINFEFLISSHADKYYLEEIMNIPSIFRTYPSNLGEVPSCEDVFPEKIRLVSTFPKNGYGTIQHANKRQRLYIGEFITDTLWQLQHVTLDSIGFISTKPYCQPVSISTSLHPNIL